MEHVPRLGSRTWSLAKDMPQQAGEPSLLIQSIRKGIFDTL